MGLMEDAQSIIKEGFGPEVAEQLKNFDNSEHYPSEFLNDCIHFLGQLIGKEAASKRFAPLVEKYVNKAAKKDPLNDSINNIKRRMAQDKQKSKKPLRK